MSSSSRRPKEPEVDDLWKQVTAEFGSGAAEQAASVGGNETFTLFVGQKQSGKSSLITAFHNPSKDDTPKPTVALEYLFARRSAASTNAPKDVAHIWELGGGCRLSALVSVPLTPLTVTRAVVAVVVDLSQPENLLGALLLWLDILRARADACAVELAASDPRAAEQLREAARQRCGGEGHADARLLKPLPVPLVIIAAKFDAFREKHDSAARRACAQCLRFVAHLHGATLLTCGAKDKASQSHLRATLTAHLFRAAAAVSGTGSGGRTKVETNPEKPMIVPAGSDSFEAILKAPPKGTEAADFVRVGGGGVSVDRAALRRWGQVLEGHFGKPSTREEDRGHEQPANSDPGEGGGVEGESKDNGGGGGGAGAEFLELIVDEARAQRDAALAAYKKEAERKRRVEASAAKGAKASSSKSSSSSSSSRSARSSSKEKAFKN